MKGSKGTSMPVKVMKGARPSASAGVLLQKPTPKAPAKQPSKSNPQTMPKAESAKSKSLYRAVKQPVAFSNSGMNGYTKRAW